MQLDQITDIDAPNSKTLTLAIDLIPYTHSHTCSFLVPSSSSPLPPGNKNIVKIF